MKARQFTAAFVVLLVVASTFVPVVAIGQLASTSGTQMAQTDSIDGATEINNSSSFPYVIDSPGTYVITEDIEQSAVYEGLIRIQSDDVILQGGGHTINGDDSYWSTGIVVNASTTLTNVTVDNVSLSNWDRGIRVNDTTESDLVNITTSSNQNRSIFVWHSTGVNVTNAVINGTGYGETTDRPGIIYEDVSNSSIRDSRVTNTTGIAIHLFDGTNLAVTDTTIDEASTAITIEDTAGGSVVANQIGSDIFGFTDVGVNLVNVSQGYVASNSLNNVNDGIILTNSSGATVTENMFEWAGVNGIVLEGTGSSIVSNNVVNADANGIYLAKPDWSGAANDDNELHNNTITNSITWGEGYAGIFVEAGENTTITENNVSNNLGNGIILTQNATIRENDIRNNGEDGILYNNSAPLSIDVDIHYNNISGNAKAGVFNLNTGDWLNATNNYWGASNGPGGGSTDPITNAIANGDGDNVSYYVHFDPYLTSPVGTAQTITVSGQVYENDSDPAANDTVAAFEAGASTEEGLIDLNRTDSSGNFTLTIPKDEPVDIRYLQLKIENDTFSPTEIPFPRDGSPDIYALDRIESATAVDLGPVTLPQAYNVNVTVEDERGAGVANATTIVTHQNPDNAATSGEFYNPTNESGWLVLNETRGPGVELADTVTLGVTPPDDPQYLQKEYSRTLTVTNNTTEPFVLEDRNTTVTGQVYENDSDPAADDLVGAIGPEGPFNFTNTTQDGSFSLAIPKNETVTIFYAQVSPEETTDIPFPRDGSPDLYTLNQTNTSTPVDIGQKTLPQAYNVNVTVTGNESGQPVPYARASITHHNPDEPTANFSFPFWMNENGSLVLNETRGPGIELADNATIDVRPPEDDPRYIQKQYNQTLPITENTTVPFVIDENVIALTGVIETSGPTPAANDTLVFTADEPYHEALTQTNATGAYEAFVAPNTPYQVQFWQGMRGEPAPADNVPDYYPLREVNETSPTTLDTVTLPEPHNLTVSVIGPDGKAVPNATAQFHLERPEAGLHLYDEGIEVDANGNATRELAGTVNLYVEPPRDAGLLGNGTELTLTEDTTVTLQLREGVNSTGQVLGPDDVGGVADARIEFQGLDEQGVQTQTQTNETGHYVGRIGTVGDYGVGFAQHTEEDMQFPDDGIPDVYALGTVNNSSRDLGPVHLPPPHNLTINVTDAEGNPVPNAGVGVDHSPGFGEHHVGARTTSGDNGEVTVEVSGDIEVHVRPPEGSDLQENATQVTVVEDMSIRVVLSGTTTVSGTVTDSAGQGASPVRLEFHALDGSGGEMTVTNETGAYSVQLPKNTTFDVEISQRDLESVPSFPNDGIPGVYQTGTIEVGSSSQTFDYQLPIGHDLNVTVENESGAGIENVDVSVGHVMNERGTFADGTTRSDGLFVPRNADDPGIEVNGTIEVHVDGGEMYLDGHREAFVDKTMGITITLSPAIHRSGRVLEPDEVGGNGAAGDMIVFERLGEEWGQMETWTDSAGNFTGKIGKTGDYGVGFIQTDSAESYEGTFPKDGVPDVYALGIVNESSGNLGTVQLPSPHNLTINVTDTDGNPVPNATVWVANAPGFGELEAGEETITGDNGEVTVEVINDTEIFVRPPDGSGLGENGTQVTVQSDQTVPIVLPERTEVTGTIEYADGGVPEDYHVSLWADNAASDTARIDSNGNFTLFVEPNQTYRFGFEQTDWDGPMVDFPRDGAPDVHVFGTVSIESGQMDLGLSTLPKGHLLNVTVVNETDSPVEGVPMDVEDQQDGASAWIHGSSDADGKLKLESAPETGVEVNGTVTIHSRPSEVGLPYLDNTTQVTVDSNTSQTIELESESVAPPPEPDISIVDAWLSEQQITTGDSVYVNVTLENTGGADGNITLQFYRNDTIKELYVEHEYTVSAETARDITVPMNFDEAGNYTISVNDTIAGEVAVEAPETTTTTETSVPGMGITTVLLALLSLTFLMVRRRD